VPLEHPKCQGSGGLAWKAPFNSLATNGCFPTSTLSTLSWHAGKLLACKHPKRISDNPENASQPKNLLHLKLVLKWDHNPVQYTSLATSWTGSRMSETFCFSLMRGGTLYLCFWKVCTIQTFPGDMPCGQLGQQIPLTLVKVPLNQSVGVQELLRKVDQQSWVPGLFLPDWHHKNNYSEDSAYQAPLGICIPLQVTPLLTEGICCLC